ncbi:MAG: hypothetical protein ACRDJP_13495 [Actinomycetota bacterium]
MLTTNHRSPIRAAADKIAERLSNARRIHDEVIDLREPAWEYDDTEIVYGWNRSYGESAIQRLLVRRMAAGWEVGDIEAEPDRCRFVFKRAIG